MTRTGNCSLKIVLCGFGCYPFHPFGGSEKRLYLLAKYLKRHGGEVEVVTSSPWNNYTSRTYDGIRFHFVPPNCAWSRPYAFRPMIDRIRFMWNLSSYLSKMVCDIVQTSANVAGFYVTNPKRKLLILQPYEEIYDLKARYVSTGGFLWALKLWLLGTVKTRWDDYCVSHSDYVASEGGFQTAAFVRTFNVSPERIIDVPVATELPEPMSETDRQDFRMKLGLRSDDLVVISVNRLDYNKGIPLLVETMKSAFERAQRLKFIVVGNGPLKQWFDEQTNKPSFTERVLRFQDVSESTLSSLYWVSDVYLSTTFDVASIQSILEGMSHHLPVVSTGQRFWIQNGYNGFIASIGDGDILADLILRVSKSNPQALGANARQTAETYSYERLALHLLEKYANILTK